MFLRLFPGALYASSSSSVAVDGSNIFGNNFATVDGGEERLDVMRSIRASRRLALLIKLKYTATKPLRWESDLGSFLADSG